MGADLSSSGMTIPPEALTDRERDRELEVCFMFAAALLAARLTGDARRIFRHLDAKALNPSDRKRWRARAEFLWALHAENMADVPGVITRCRETDRLMGASAPDVSEEYKFVERTDSVKRVDTLISRQLPILAARAHLRAGQLDRAEVLLEAPFATQAGGQSSQPALVAMWACHQGRLTDALRLATAALNLSQDGPSALESDDLDARLVRAEVFFERNQLDAAENELETAIRLCCLTGATQWIWVVEVHRIRLALAQGRATEALLRINSLKRTMGDRIPLHPALQRLDQVEIDCRLALGDLAGALELIRSQSPEGVCDETLTRVDLFSGRPDRASSRLRGACSPESPRVGVRIRRLILLACTDMQQGRRQRAEDAIRRALDAGRSDGYVRPFLEGVSQILPLLHGLAASLTDPYLSGLIVEAERLVPTRVGQPGPVLEPLTARERQVMTFLPSHLNVGQIASVMCLSTNTVKTHIKNIYRKTGAISRDAAVTIAHSHGLL
jgi:LuxR family maltose regulon positive regulatory protein